jgi:hypothetical protein
VDVYRELLSIFVFIDQDSFVATLEQVTRPPPFHVKICRVGTVYVFHDLRQIRARSLHQKVVVI